MTVTVLTVSGIAVGAGGGEFGFDSQQASGSAGDRDPGTEGFPTQTIPAGVDGSGSGAAVPFEQSTHDDGWEDDDDRWDDDDDDRWEDDDDDDRWEDDDDGGAEDD
jgi:hypothetical protein